MHQPWPFALSTLAAALVLFALAPGARAQGEDFVNFETAPVHPVDLSPSGQFLAVAHLADNRALIYDLSDGSPVLSRSIPVGIDPVSARFRTDTELWVVNHISDTITILDASNGAVMGLI